MDSSDTLTFDQLLTLVAIADHKTFSGASRAMGRAQSGVSYQVQRLEDSLGLVLFEREGRRPVLTPAGRRITEEARAVIQRVASLQAAAAAFSAGVEVSCSFGVDVLFPAATLSLLAERFGEVFPQTELRIRTGVLDQVPTWIRTGECDVGVTGAPSPPAEFELEPSSAVDLIPVAAPDHPLAGRKRVTLKEALRHRQLLLSDGATETLERDRDTLADKVWRIDDSATRLALLRKGLGWCRMPGHVVEDDVVDGSLSVLAWNPPLVETVPLFAAHDPARAPGPAARWLLDEIVALAPAGKRTATLRRGRRGPAQLG